MGERWAVALARKYALQAGFLRLNRGIQACEVGPMVWLRGYDLTEELSAALRRLPGAVRYSVLPDGRLLRAGSRIPRGRLPSASWQLLKKLIQLHPQSAAFPGEIGRKVALRLQRSEREREARALLTRIESWTRYAAGAAEIRLDGLEFACHRDGTVFVRAKAPGAPLPPLSAERFVEDSGIFWPCGFGWSPEVGGALLRDLLALPEGELALFLKDGSYQRIRKSHLVRASRSAARLTLEKFSHGS